MPNALTLSGTLAQVTTGATRHRRDIRHVGHHWRCNHTKKPLGRRCPLPAEHPLRNFPVASSGIRRSGPPVPLPALTGRSGPTITKDVICITLDIHLDNTERVGVSNALPALCMGKPITAGVVAF